MIKTNKDIPAGAIVTSKNNKQYVVYVDQAGQRFLLLPNGKFYRFNGDTLTFDGTGSVSKVQVFDTAPEADQFSEAVKAIILGGKLAPTAVLKTIYTAEDPRVTQAKKDLAALEARGADLRATIARYSN
jgi:hypothetical protein